MITCEDCDDIKTSSALRFFSNKEAIGLYEWYDWPAEKGLERLVFQVARRSNCLESHLERIYYCFNNHLGDQLVGALVDLLITLNNRGQALARRMVLGAKPQLPENQFAALINYIDNNLEASQLPGNRYSIFARGLQSTAALLHLNESVGKAEHDPLILARDFIEFSQLDDAVYVLEQAIALQPERMELHSELLSLYRSTLDQTRFNRIYEELSSQGINLPPDWELLKDFFSRLIK